MLYEQIAATIQEYGIPRSTVAKLAGLWPTDLSGWLNRGQSLSPEREQRIAQAVSDIAKMVAAMRTLGIKVDLRDPAYVLQLVQKVNDAEMQLDLALDTQPESAASKRAELI